jgi:uncharacterized protein involved in exopolysaccharide biosynthesis
MVPAKAEIAHNEIFRPVAADRARNKMTTDQADKSKDRVVLLVPAPTDDGHILPSALFKALFRGWLLIGAITTVCAVAAVALALWLRPVYEGEVIVAAVEESGSMSSTSGQLGSLAAAAGLNLGGLNSRKSEYIALLSSRAMVGALIDRENLMPVLFEARWDPVAKAWKGSDPKQHPTRMEAIEHVVNQMLEVTYDNRSGLITVRVEWSDPVLAAKWANELVALVNQHVRSTVIADSRRAVEFLEAEIAKNASVDVRQGIFRLQELNLNRVVLATVQVEYALKIIDPALPADRGRPIRPRKFFIAVAGVFLGVTIGSFVVLLRSRRDWWRATPPATGTAA